MGREVFGWKLGLIIPRYIGHIINGCEPTEEAWSSGDQSLGGGLAQGGQEVMKTRVQVEG